MPPIYKQIHRGVSDNVSRLFRSSLPTISGALSTAQDSDCWLVNGRAGCAMGDRRIGHRN
jgi:hypothetical protein